MAEKPKPSREIVLDFADGKYPFCLTLGMIAEVQTKTGYGIGAVYRRILSQSADVHDAIEVTRHGLMGAGLDAVRAGQLIERYGELPMMSGDEWYQLAAAILAHYMHGYRPEGEDGKKTTAPKDGSTSPKPTEPDS